MSELEGPRGWRTRARGPRRCVSHPDRVPRRCVSHPADTRWSVTSDFGCSPHPHRGLAAKPSAVKSLPEPQEWQAYHFYSDHWFLLVKMVLIKVTNAAFISAALGRHPAEGEIRALCEASERPALQRGSPLGTQFSCSSPQGTATGMSG